MSVLFSSGEAGRHPSPLFLSPSLSLGCPLCSRVYPQTRLGSRSFKFCKQASGTLIHPVYGKGGLSPPRGGFYSALLHPMSIHYNHVHPGPLMCLHCVSTRAKGRPRDGEAQGPAGIVHPEWGIVEQCQTKSQGWIKDACLWKLDSADKISCIDSWKGPSLLEVGCKRS